MANVISPSASPATAVNAVSGMPPAGGADAQALGKLGESLLVGQDLENQLSQAADDLSNPTAAGLLRVQLLTSQLSVNTASTGSALKVLNDTAKVAVLKF